MKKLLLAGSISLAFLAPAHAAGPYVGLSVDTFKKDVSGNRESSVKVSGGYDVNESWGVEVGALAIPKYESGDNGGIYRETSGNAFYVAAKANTPLADKLFLTSKLGLARTSLRFKESTIGVDGTSISHDSSIGLFASLGLRYALTDKTSLTLDFTRLGRTTREVSGGHRRDTVSVGVNYSF